MKLEAQFRADVLIRQLLKRKPYVQSDGFPIRIARAAIGSLHDSRTAAGADHEAVRVICELVRPLGHQARQRAGVAIEQAQRPVFVNSR